MKKIRWNHKDRLFCHIFSEKENALSLYNALNGTNFENADDLKVVTLEDALYLTMNNDVGILCQDVLELWEHQSSINPNIPLRGLLYFAREYEGWLAKNGKALYSSSPIKIPAPRFYVLYNGTKSIEGFGAGTGDRMKVRLSDLFMTPSKGYEWTATVLDVNSGHSADVMDKCPVLRDYAKFIHEIRKNQDGGMNLENAVNTAIDFCIAEGVLQEYLLKTKGEVRDMILTEYNEELHNRTMREEGREEGIALAYTNLYKDMRISGYSREEAQRLTRLSDKQAEEIEEEISLRNN